VRRPSDHLSEFYSANLSHTSAHHHIHFLNVQTYELHHFLLCTHHFLLCIQHHVSYLHNSHNAASPLSFFYWILIQFNPSTRAYPNSYLKTPDSLFFIFLSSILSHYLCLHSYLLPPSSISSIVPFNIFTYFVLILTNLLWFHLRQPCAYSVLPN
jgi:hypothetical protein